MKEGRPQPWTDDELKHLVKAYCAMLALEVAGEKYSKAEHNLKLQTQINRSRGSIEMKMMNVSAVLVEMKRRFIKGYKPYPNYQSALKAVVLAQC